MSDTPFKTPLPHRRRENLIPSSTSDSDESVTSSHSDNFSSAPSEEISLVAEFDDLRRHRRLFHDSALADLTALIKFVEKAEQVFLENYQLIQECKRLNEVVEKKGHDCTDLEHKLQIARKLLDKEKQNTQRTLHERDELLDQLDRVRELLYKDKSSFGRAAIPEEMHRKLAFLHKNTQSDYDVNANGHPNLSCIKEINSTGSILSEFSYSRSEDDLDSSSVGLGKGWKTHRPSGGGTAEPPVKKRRSAKAVEIAPTDTVRATTTVTVSKDGPITATSVIESVPKTPIETNSEGGSSEQRRFYPREHSFQQKTLVMPETCGACEKRIRFAKVALKCKECKAICHLECKGALPLPCVPIVYTPNHKNALGVIGDYTPTIPPMVPAILIHCINEIELRGLSELGIYRVPGAERDVKALKERFLKNKGAPCISNIDVHVICGTVKDFLRTLHEPLVTYKLWPKFVRAVETNRSVQDMQAALQQVISELPQPNRDTLAYMILHLQRVSEAKDCKMGVSNLAKMFGPTIVGYSCEDPDPNSIVDEMRCFTKVMEELIQLPADYWSSFINVSTVSLNKLQQTPSTDSLLRPLSGRGIFTPTSSKKRQKYFPSPKSFR